MSVVTLGQDAKSVPVDEVNDIMSKAGLTAPNNHVEDWGVMLGAMEQSIKSVLDEKDYVPTTDPNKYPRTAIVVPKYEDSNKGGWAAKCVAKATEPKNDLLKGKTVALKDNVALAGVRCTNGTEAMDWTPKFDATVAMRIMDAGGIITGKAACENACMEGVSDTSCTGKVHNAYVDNYSAGGSSSGSGRLVAVGAADMAIGCDQGGSIRIPASMNGVVGLKPTWGLVPYTGIISFECTIDHAGPMAKNVRDTALLLEAIAGPDGMDDRQPFYLPPGALEYSTKLDEWRASIDPSKPLAGTRIGVLKEGFQIPGMDPNIRSLCESAVSKFKDLGAELVNVSIPGHLNAAIVWMCSIPTAGVRQGFFTDMTGRKQLFLLDRIDASGNPMPQKAFDALGPGARNTYVRYLYLEGKYGPQLHAKCSNLLRKINVSTLA
jgi:amidase